ncbi:MAG: Cdc6-like AAA superfamily ATPase [Saprospiraceae bacterium]|jgi:Cdc6-like AAA superfamily ATPase
MSNYNTDKPIKEEKDDFFQRYNFSKAVANSIKNFKEPECMVFSINGAWGEGKTSVLNFIEGELSKEGSEVLCIRFNPWQYRDEGVILYSLFNAIALKFNELIIEDSEKQNKIFGKRWFARDNENPLKGDFEIVGGLLRDYGEAASVLGVGNALTVVGKGISNTKIEEIQKLKIRRKK